LNKKMPISDTANSAEGEAKVTELCKANYVSKRKRQMYQGRPSCQEYGHRKHLKQIQTERGKKIAIVS